MNSISFEDLGLDDATLAAVEAKGFETPSPIQVLAIPRLLNGDANVIAKARTGTGKTAAFGLPLVQTIRQDKGHPQALILTPTRELALQVCKEIASFSTGVYPRMTSVYGGQSMSEQLRALKRGVEIVVGTPGRVKDHLERGSLKLDNISYFILDEADEMLDMGFIEDIETIFSKANPNSRILLFSATMPAPILKIAGKFMGEYEIVQEEERPEEPLLTDQHYWFVRENEKVEALVRLIDISPDFYGLVFTQTKSDADSVTRQLDERGYEAAALHGDIPQNQREKILCRFRSKKTRILVATDVAARGIDIEGLTHVVNFALPFDGPTYVHRIGRTGRAGAKGLAYTFIRPEERRKLDYLKQFAQKATKGEMKEETVPSVEKVLSVKRERLFSELKERIAELVTESTPSESLNTLIDSMCENIDPKAVLAAVLEEKFGKQLDPSRYGEVSSIKAGGASGKQIRIYVQLGKKDNYYAREIAELFSKLCKIPQRFVDRIEVTEKFSLVNLPYQAGMQLIELANRDKSLPSMHIDAKGSSNNSSFGGERSGRRDRGYRRSGSSSRGGNSRGESRNGRSGRGSAVPVHSDRSSNAKLYKKSR